MGELEGRLANEEKWKGGLAEHSVKARHRLRVSQDAPYPWGFPAHVTEFTTSRAIVTPCLERKVQSRGWNRL